MKEIEDIEKLKKLLDAGAITKSEYDHLLNNLLGVQPSKKTKEQELLESGAITKEQYDLLVNRSGNAGNGGSQSNNGDYSNSQRSFTHDGINSNNQSNLNNTYGSYTNKNIYDENFNISNLSKEEIELFSQNNFTGTFSSGLGVFLNFLTFGLFCIFSTAFKHEKLIKFKSDDISGGAAVGLLFVPIYNLFWLFKVQGMVVKRINFQFKLRNLPPPISSSLATTVCILQVIPYVNLLNTLIIFPIYYSQVQNACNKLAEMNRTL